MAILVQALLQQLGDLEDQEVELEVILQRVLELLDKVMLVD
jgi:hypothetical protein